MNEEKSHRQPCSICSLTTERSAPAYIAPFLRKRCGISDDVEGRVHFCEGCEHIFFTPLLEPPQLAALYAGYRDERYTTERLEVEPSYAAYVEPFADPQSRYHQVRREFYDFFLPELRQFRGQVTDFGGGDGGFTNYVFPDAQIVVADETFERDGGDLGALLATTDILFAAHVLEHLPHPMTALSRMTAALRPGARVYVELPIEYPGLLRDAFARIEAELEPQFSTSLQVMHEHVAHFSRHSAATLLRRCGLVVDETARFGPEMTLMALWAHKPAPPSHLANDAAAVPDSF